MVEVGEIRPPAQRVQRPIEGDIDSLAVFDEVQKLGGGEPDGERALVIGDAFGLLVEREGWYFTRVATFTLSRVPVTPLSRCPVIPFSCFPLSRIPVIPYSSFSVIPLAVERS